MIASEIARDRFNSGVELACTVRAMPVSVVFNPPDHSDVRGHPRGIC
jgi:hypothetical protein